MQVSSVNRSLAVKSNGSGANLPSWDYESIYGEAGMLPFSPADLFLRLNRTTVLLSVLYSITFVVGIVGNILVTIVFTRHKRMRSVTNLFLVNLAIADLSVVSVCMPITLGSYVYRDWVYGDIMCKLTPFLQGTAVCVSVLSLLVISMNRYYGIHKPIKAKAMFSRNKVLVTLALVWAEASVSCSPLLFVNRVKTYGIPGLLTRVCSEEWGNGVTGKQAFNVFLFLVMFALPVIVMTLAYARISGHLWTGDVLLKRRGSEVLKEQQTRVMRQRRQTVKMLIVLVLLFTISWLPYHIVNLWLDYNIKAPEANHIAENVYPFVQWFGFTNSSMNPVCYGFLSVKFRKALLSMCCPRIAQPTPPVIVTSQRYSATSDTIVNGTTYSPHPYRPSFV